MNYYNSNPQSPKKQRQNPTTLIEVYADNFIKEIKHLSSYLDEYNYIGMDTEFPGIVYKLESYTNDFYYKSIEKNVNKLKIIQLGISLCNSKGEHPNISTWQFNFNFDTLIDKYSNDSISLLINSGIKFDLLKTKGIPHNLFAEYLITSGLLLNENIHWISYHGVTDFAYLLKLALNYDLTSNEKDFLYLLKLYFPSFYDIRILIQNKEQFKGGLNKLIQCLNIERNGDIHQAGSDSLVTAEAFFDLINKGIITTDEVKDYENILYGIGEGEDNNETISYVPFSNNMNLIGIGINNRNIINNLLCHTALDVNSPIYVPNIGLAKKNRLSGNVQYPLINQMMGNNNMGNGMIFGYNNSFVS